MQLKRKLMLSLCWVLRLYMVPTFPANIPGPLPTTTVIPRPLPMTTVTTSVSSHRLTQTDCHLKQSVNWGLEMCRKKPHIYSRRNPLIQVQLLGPHAVH